MQSNWQPSASIENLRARARIIQRIRDFFNAHQVLEVETPLLCYTSVTAPHIQSIPAFYQLGLQEQRYYLQTSPEYMMKRLLAANSGDIYQLCKAFRQDEAGRFHNPEFTMLEWYRIGFDHHALMNDMDELLQRILNVEPAERVSYQALFETHLQINPHTISIDNARACAKQHGINMQEEINDIDTWLQLLCSHYIEPRIGLKKPIFVYDYPVSQAALARIQPGNPPVASRFEVYFKGIELANGFHELANATEQRARFENDLIERKKLGLTELPIDEYFLTALTHGLPDCAGVALGIDRLMMLALNAKQISDVVSFDIRCA